MILRSGLALIALALIACTGANVTPYAGAAGSPVASLSKATGTANDIPPRLQWEANYGYCGEVSLISAGLYYGQYASQYTARQLASNDIPQSREQSQLLLGVNAAYAAERMHLEAQQWNTSSQQPTSAFLAWVKSNVQAGLPVAIGIYTNEYRFYNNQHPRAGDTDYDHIVPVTAVTDTALTFSDNGLWGKAPYPYVFTYPFASFPQSRVGANAPKGPIYSIENGRRNFGIAISGVVDASHETLPVRVATNVNYEKPSMQDGSNTRPQSMPLVLTITVSNLQPGIAYYVYRYDDFSSVPNGAFNANASKASERRNVTVATAGSYTFTEKITSDQTAVYRAVPASSP